MKRIKKKEKKTVTTLSCNKTERAVFMKELIKQLTVKYCANKNIKTTKNIF